jgi:putative hydrolase of the HAD superfamily
MIRAILFDLDGTLVDRQAAHRQYCLDLIHRRPEVFAASRRADALPFLLGWPDRDRHVFSRRVAKAFPGLGLPERLAEDHARRLPGFIKPDAAIVRLLQGLKERYMLGVVSNGDGSVQRAKLDAAGLSAYFDHVFISGEQRAAKPHAAAFQRALSDVRTAPAEALFVGDDPAIDIAGAAGAGMKTCWISSGREFPECVVRPEHTIDRVHELRRVLP